MLDGSGKVGYGSELGLEPTFFSLYVQLQVTMLKTDAFIIHNL